MVVTPSLPVNDAGLVRYAKERPGQVNFTSSGVGSITHLTGELMKRRAGFEMTHVSYKGSAPAAIDTISGVVQAMFDNLPGSLANIKAGKLKPLATLSRERSAALPDVATLHESGFPDFDPVAWQCVAAPERHSQSRRGSIEPRGRGNPQIRGCDREVPGLGGSGRRELA